MQFGIESIAAIAAAQPAAAPVGAVPAEATQGAAAPGAFASLLQRELGDLNASLGVAEKAMTDLAAGKPVELHEVMISLERANIVLCSFAAGVGLLRDDIDQGLVHVGREVRGVPTDIDMGPIFQPVEEVMRPLLHTVLNICLFPPLGDPIPRKGDIHPGQRAVLQPSLPVGLVKEVAAEIAFPEEEPAFAIGSPGFALLQKGPIRCDARARTDHARRRAAR